MAKQEILNDISRKNLLDNVFQPEEGFTFPRKWLHGCFRSLNFKLWTKRYPCLLYNRSMDSAFCLSGVLFAKSSTSLFNKLPGFGKWYKAGDEAAYQRGHWGYGIYISTEMYLDLTTIQYRYTKLLANRLHKPVPKCKVQKAIQTITSLIWKTRTEDYWCDSKDLCFSVYNKYMHWPYIQKNAIK